MARFSLSLAPGEPAMPMRRCEMKKVLGIYNNPDQGRSTLIKAIIPIFVGLFIVPAQAQWLGPTWETRQLRHHDGRRSHAECHRAARTAGRDGAPVDGRDFRRHNGDRAPERQE